MTEATWAITRTQLIDALANIEIRNIKTTGPAAGLVVADDLADAILSQLDAVSHRETATAAAIARAERERLAAVISPEQFRKLAGWFDADDQFKEAMFPETWSPGTRKDDVQQDLRKFADLLASE